MEIKKKRVDVIEKILNDLENYTNTVNSMGTERIYTNCRRSFLSELNTLEWLGIISVKERSAYIERFDTDTLGKIKSYD